MRRSDELSCIAPAIHHDHRQITAMAGGTEWGGSSPGKIYGKDPPERLSGVGCEAKDAGSGLLWTFLREIFACNAEVSLRGPAATKTGASDNAPGDRAKKPLHLTKRPSAPPLPRSWRPRVGCRHADNQRCRIVENGSRSSGGPRGVVRFFLIIEMRVWVSGRSGADNTVKPKVSFA
jgi:hypothetical protein